MKNEKHIAAALLALALLLGLAGCGTDPAGSQPAAPGSGGPEAPPRYEAVFTELSPSIKGSVTPLAYAGEGFYALAYESVGQRELGEGVTAAYEGQYERYENRLYFIGYDGVLDRMEAYRPAWVPEDAEGRSDFSSGSRISGACLNGAEELLVLEADTASWYEGPEGLTQEDNEYWKYYKTETRIFLRRLDREGGELSRAELALEDCRLLNDGCLLDEAGNLLLTYISEAGDSFLAAVAEDGAVVYRLLSDGYLNGLVRLGDGRPAALGNLPEGWGLWTVDTAAKSFGKAYLLPGDAAEPIAGDGAYDLYYTGGSYLYGYTLETGEKQPVLNWMDCDVNGSELAGVSLLPDGAIRAVENAWSGDGMTASLVKLAKAPAGSRREKQVLTMAVLSLDTSVQQAVVAFNRESEDARIEVVDYSQYNTDSEDSAGLTKLTTEILSGNLPDILSLDGLPYDQLAAKGLLEDLYPWLDADGEITRGGVFPSVLKAMEAGGRLCQVCPYFSVRTAIGARSAVGDRTGWTYEELYAALEALPEGSTVFSPSMTKDGALTSCLAVSLDSLVDWAGGTCRFDSEEFLALLDFANRFPAEPREQEDGGVQLLRSVTVSEFRSLPFQELDFGGNGSTSYVGYPTADGSCGSAIVLDDGFAMSAACAHKEAAWAFLRVFMTDGYQSNLYKLPVNRARFEKNLAQAMAPTYALDEKGDYVLDRDGNRIIEPVAELDGMKVYPPTQEQADRLLALVEGCDKAVRPAADTVLGIVLENAGDYFSGEKTASETAALIQSRVSLYMNEQR